MKSIEFLTEDKIELAFKYADKYKLDVYDTKFALDVKEHCQKFLQECKSSNSDPFILYRGVNESKDTIEKEVRLTDRRPLNMDKLLHQKINYYLDDNYGHPYRNAMFCTGDLSSADYGNQTYYVFPTGDYDFLWSQNQQYDDLYMAWQKWTAGRTEPTFKLIQQEFIVDDFLKSARYTNQDIVRAAKSGNEIMMWTPMYYGIHAKYEHWEKLVEIMYDEK